jgi:hypothetical protein
MASTFSTRLKIELIGSGEQAGSWGTTTNNNFSQSVEQAIAGVLTIATSGTGTTTLTTGNGPQAAADNQARQAALRFTNASATHTVQYPAVEKLYLLVNGSSTCTFTHRLGASGNTITLLPNKTKMVATDGTNWFTLETTGSTYIEKTSAYTAFAGDNIFVDTSAGAVTITLPSSPTQGDAVSFIDAEGTFDTNNLTVEPGSEKIMANTAGDEMVVDTNNAGFTLVYQDSTHGWRLKDK